MKWWLGIVAALCLIIMPVHVYASSEQTINGDMTVDEDWTLTTDTIVTGNLTVLSGDGYNGNTVNLNGHTLTVGGSFIQKGGKVWIEGGCLKVSGDFVQEEGYNSRLYMGYYDTSTVVIGGSFKTYSTGSFAYYMSGTLRIAGDLIVGAGNQDNFHTIDSELQVVLTGEGSHQISFLEENSSHITNLTVESGKITANEMLSIGKLNSDLEITGYSGKSFSLRALNANGHTVSFQGDVITTGEINLKGGELTVNGNLTLTKKADLAGGKLTINGNLTQQGGAVWVNKGVLTVSGDFEQKEGYESWLVMQNTDDIVRVEGNYATYSTASHNGYLSAGELTVNGDFTQGQGSGFNFYATGSHTTRLTGEELQTVVFTPDKYGTYISKFNNLYVNKDPKTGYRFTPDQCWNSYEEVPQAEKQVRSFVSRMYTVALGRGAEEQGLKDWTERLLSHEVDGAGIAHGFIMSDEFQNRNLNDGEFVDVLYRTFFDREADAGGRDNWLAALAAGKTRGYVLSGFVNSIEFDKLCESYGITRGTMSEGDSPVNAGIRQFVERCYTKVLSRAGEEAGVADWTNRISTGQMSAEDVAKSFFFSVEYTNKNTDNETFAETLYQTFMDRASDPAGKADWVGRLNGGTSRQEVLEGFSRSAEFAGILQSYGL